MVEGQRPGRSSAVHRSPLRVGRVGARLRLGRPRDHRQVGHADRAPARVTTRRAVRRQLLERVDPHAGLLEQLALGGRREVLVDLHEPSRQRPASAVRLLAPSYDECAQGVGTDRQRHHVDRDREDRVVAGVHHAHTLQFVLVRSTLLGVAVHLDDAQRDRAAGVLLGQAAGDALGCAVRVRAATPPRPARGDARRRPRRPRARRVERRHRDGDVRRRRHRQRSRPRPRRRDRRGRRELPGLDGRRPAGRRDRRRRRCCGARCAPCLPAPAGVPG